MPEPVQILSQGATGVVIRFATRLSDAANRAALAAAAALSADPPRGMEECSPALASVFLRFNPDQTDFDTLANALHQRLERQDFFSAPLPRNRRLWHVPTVFGGGLAPGLDEAAAKVGLPVPDAIAALTERPVRVLAIGYGPGQPYLGELPPAFDIPRLPDLIQVPRSAVVLAIRQLVIFANPGPTGWRHVAQTAIPLFRPECDTPFLLNPGDEVWLQPVSEDRFQTLQRDPLGGATSEALP